jgi:predicted unusual protein kinase regulating ubiquinone biosynthesis (AarF/ABC1/UbiB family)
MGRLVRLAGTGARTGLGLLYKGDGSATALRAADALGTLRGLASKAGQMASYVDGLVPEAQAGAFENALARLRDATPTSPPEQVRALLESELDAPIEHLFSEFDEQPMASASIGQVHRACLADGTPVAVKVQHPGIERAVRSDLDNGSVIEGMVGSLGARRFGSKEVYGEIRARFLEELDYGLEAERQQAFRRIHEGDDDIVVPAVITSHSARRVLTSERIDGGSLERAAEGPESERAAYSRTLWRFVFRSVLLHGQFNADPHPGNYFFQGNGRIGFLDFGCVQPLPKPHRMRAVGAHRAAGEGDEERFRQEVRAMLGLRGGRYEDAVLDYTRRCFEPLFGSPFRFDREYVEQLVRGIRELKLHLVGERQGAVPLPPEMALMNRLQFGFYSVLARLGAEVDYAGLERELLADA